MSVAYKPVGWNINKIFYDVALLLIVSAYVAIFTAVARNLAPGTRLDDATIDMRAYGSCAFLMLTLVLSIGPLARLDPRFLPLLYNRRHFGVLTCGIALMHARHVLAWYFGFSPVDPFVALLSSNTSYAAIAGFPFELLGVLALTILVALAATSHDFWLAFLTPPLWKAMHMSIYAAYAFVVAHVAWGALLTPRLQAMDVVVPASAFLLVALHLAASARQRRLDEAEASAGWISAGSPADIQEGRAIIIPIAGNESVAIFRNDNRLSAIANACRHQNGPLGEGRIVDGCVTCPWHGFQYRLEDGCAPAPFTEKLATYDLRLRDGVLWLNPKAHPPGTRVEPLRLGEAE